MNVRLIFFTGGLFLFTLFGLLKPYIRAAKMGALFGRMGVNITFGAMGALLTNLIVPGGLYLLSTKLDAHGFGFFNRVGLPYFLEFAITIVFLDLAIYAQHVLSHHWSFLWRFHKVHHGDTFFDTTTALRFHPGEILISFGFKALLISLFGLDATAVMVFEIILNFSAMFNHSNFSLPEPLENIIRKVIVTPDFHRVHHSPVRSSTDTNYGFFFSFWDTLFGTLNKTVTTNKVFGLNKASYSGSNHLLKLLWAPLVSKES